MSKAYADCIAQQAKLGIVRGASGEDETGKGMVSKADAIARAEFKHSREEKWLLKGKGCMYSALEAEEVELGGETELVRPGTCVGKDVEEQPQEPGDESRDIWSKGSALVEGGGKGSDFLRSQCFSEKTGISKNAQ